MNHIFRKKLQATVLFFVLFFGVIHSSFADVTITSISVPAAGINQGTNNNVVYIAQMSVTIAPVTVNNIQFTLTGTFDLNDLSNVLVYFNASSPVFAGSSFLGSAVATFAAPHTYSINISRAMAAGSTGYFIILTNVTANATNNNTVKINGATNPATFGFTSSPTIVNSQTDAAGIQTIQAANVTVSSSAVTAGNIDQGSNNNVLYIAQMSVATSDVVINNVQFSVGGTYDANDLSTVLVYFNASAPTFTGSNFLGSAVASFAAPHTFSINISQSISAAGSGYFIIVANVSANATDNNTIKINGATNPVVFGFTTSPNIVNVQSDIAGVQTIQAADITLNTTAVASTSFPRGTNNNIVYITEMAVANSAVSVNNIQFTLTGTYDANDLATVLVYFNAASPDFAGSSFLGSAVATFAAPHTYSINTINTSLPAGTNGYFLIVANVNATATLGNIVTINGATNPVTFGFTTSPNITNLQTNTGGLHALPVNFVTVSAQNTSTGVALTWKASNEVNVQKYIVARSTDGRSFLLIGETPAIAGSTNIINYKFLDASPITGKSFYRINAVNKDGRIELSPVVSINLNKEKEGISIYPNPVVKNGLLTLELQDLVKDIYTITIYNSHGQEIFRKKIEHENGNSVQTVALPKSGAGLYSIVVQNQNKRFSKTFILQ